MKPRAILMSSPRWYLLPLPLLAVACGSPSDGDTGSGGAGSGGAGATGNTMSGGSTSGGTGGSTGGVGGASTAPSGMQCEDTRRAGGFTLRLAGDRTIFSGAVSDGIAPSAIHHEFQSEGGCALVGPRDLFCEDACASGQVCAGDNQCVATPVKQSAGPVSVTGLDVPLSASANGITVEYSATILDPYPAYTAGAALELAASGDFFSAFTLHGWAVPELSSTLTTVPVTRGEPVSLSWDASAADPEQSQIFIDFSVNVHGATTGWIECTVPDSGSFDIPASLVTALIDLGLSGFPRMTMTRRSADTTDLSSGDCVEFFVASPLTLELSVDGLVSCEKNEDCPDGQTCTTELACE